jgi:hypothetical protein
MLAIEVDVEPNAPRMSGAACIARITALTITRVTAYDAHV